MCVKAKTPEGGRFAAGGRDGPAAVSGWEYCERLAAPMVFKDPTRFAAAFSPCPICWGTQA